MISTALLDYLRTVSETAMPDTAAILRYTETSTSDGISQSWQTIASGIACRVDIHRLTASEQVGTGGVVRAISDWVVHLPALTDITERDRITVTGTGRTDNRTFEVTEVANQSYEIERECRCTLLG